MACRSRIEHHEGAPRFRDNMRESMEHGDFLGAWRSKILKQQRPALLVEVTAAACQYFSDIPLRLDPGVDPVDRQARHRAINYESDVSCRIGRAEVDGMTPLAQSHGNGGGNRRLSDPAVAHDHDETAGALRDVVDQPVEARQVNRLAILFAGCNRMRRI